MEELTVEWSVSWGGWLLLISIVLSNRCGCWITKTTDQSMEYGHRLTEEVGGTLNRQRGWGIW
jgi:hypothetical protein